MLSTALLPFGNLVCDAERKEFLAQSGTYQTAVNGLHAQNTNKMKFGKNISLKTSSYTRARARLSTAAIQQLTKNIGKGTRKNAEIGWLWKGKNVTILDGSTY